MKRRLLHGLWGGLAIAAAVLLGSGVSRVDGSVLRQRVVEFALGEMPAPNVEKYWRDVLGPNYVGPYPPYWCGAFALWALHAAGLGLKLRWIVGFGFLANLRIIPLRESPRPGDIAYFNKLQHHAIVEKVDGSTIHLINGNAATRQSSQPSEDRRSAEGSIARSTVSRSQISNIYSIDSLLP